MTTDEFIHIAAGFAYATKHDFRLSPEHPTLTKWLAALPLLATKANFPKGSLGWADRHQTLFASDFWRANKDRQRELLFLARIPLLLYCTVLAIFVFLFARSLYGVGAAFLALFLFAFEPNLIAHSSLANNDAAAAMTSTAALYFAHRFFSFQRIRYFIGMLIFSGLAIVTEFSCLVLVPIILVLHAYYVFSQPTKSIGPFALGRFLRPEWAKKLAALVIVSLALAGVGAVVVAASYEFRLTFNTSENTPTFLMQAQEALPEWLPGKQGLIGFAQLIPLPNDYIRGLNELYRHQQTGHRAVLLGQQSDRGWWYYFPVVLAFKTPLPLLAMILLSLLLGIWKRRRIFMGEVLLVFPVAVYGIFAMLSTINIGVRHILFIFPPMIIFASGVMKGSFEGGKRNLPRLCNRLGLSNLLMLVLCAYLAVSVWIQAPYYLSYMNELAGGASRRVYLMGDSNLDWGQGLPALESWVRSNKVDRIHLYYSSRDDPTLYDFEYLRESRHKFHARLLVSGEVYAISAILLTYPPFSALKLEPDEVVGDCHLDIQTLTRISQR